MFIHTGCEKTEDPITPVDENVDKEATTSKNMLELGKALTDANSFVYLYNNGVPSSSSCPNYYFDSLIYGALIVDYGSFPGCVSSENFKRSGRYILTLHSFAGGDSTYTSILFNDYRVYKYPTTVDTNLIRMTGSMNFSTKKISGTTYSFHASGEVVYTTNLGGNKTITLNNFSGTVNYNTVNTRADDAYSIYGALSINDADFGRTYSITINQSTALQILGSCHYPLSGIAKISGSGNVDCDFSPNANACDAIAKLTKGSTSKTVDLSEVNF